MQTSNAETAQAGGWRRITGNRWAKIVGIVLVAVVVALLIVPFFINADTFRPMVESELSSALGRKVTIGNLTYSFFSSGLTAQNVTVAEDPKFGTAPFFVARSMRIGVNTGALIFHHALSIHSFRADRPVVRLIAGPNGTWNYSSLANASATSTPAASSGSAPQISVGKFQIRDGSVIVQSRQGGKPFVYSHVNVTVRHLSLTQAMPFDVTAKLAGGGSLALRGTAGPLNRQDASATPLQASLTVQHFDPVNAGVLPASEGVSMVADVNAQVQSNGRTLTSSGKITAADLLLSRSGTPAAQPVDMSYRLADDLQTRTGTLQDLTIQTGQAAAHVTGTFQTASTATTLNLRLSAPNLPVDRLEQLLPAMGIHLPKGSQLKGGTLTANLAITGTASAPVIAGPVEMDNTRLAGFDLGSKMAGLKMLHSLGSDTEIRTLKADVTSTVPQTQLANIYADVPAIGTATGQGTVSAAGALNFQLRAKLSSSGAVGGLMNSAAGALGSVAGGLLKTSESDGVPVTVTGTSSDPVIRVNVAGMFTGGGAGSKAAAKGLLKGLMGR